MQNIPQQNKSEAWEYIKTAINFYYVNHRLFTSTAIIQFIMQETNSKFVISPNYLKRQLIMLETTKAIKMDRIEKTRMYYKPKFPIIGSRKDNSTRSSNLKYYDAFDVISWRKKENI